MKELFTPSPHLEPQSSNTEIKAAPPEAEKPRRGIIEEDGGSSVSHIRTHKAR